MFDAGITTAGFVDYLLDVVSQARAYVKRAGPDAEGAKQLWRFVPDRKISVSGWWFEGAFLFCDIPQLRFFRFGERHKCNYCYLVDQMPFIDPRAEMIELADRLAREWERKREWEPA